VGAFFFAAFACFVVALRWMLVVWVRGGTASETRLGTTKGAKCAKKEGWPEGVSSFRDFRMFRSCSSRNPAVSVRVIAERRKDLLRLAAQRRARQEVPAEALLGEADRGCGLVGDATRQKPGWSAKAW
jgi:hypothetical protein